MNRLRIFAARLRELVTFRRVERDLHDELDAHLDHLTDDYIRRGLPPDAARRAARRDFGGLGAVDRTTEAVLDRRGFRPLDTLANDVRYAIRLLLKTPGFTIVVTATLALGIGVNTAIFSVVDAVMLRPLPYPESGRLVSIWEARPPKQPQRLTTSGASIGANAKADPGRMTVAPATLVDYQSRTTQFSGVAGEETVALNLTGVGTPESLFGEEVTYNYFSVLQVEPERGRAFDQDDGRIGADQVVIISHDLWTSRFNSNPGIVGQVVTLDAKPYSVIGVMPAGFRGISQFGRPDPLSIWVPARYPAELLANHGDHEINAVARLNGTATVERARADIASVSQSLARQFPDTNDGVTASLRPLRDDIVMNVRLSLTALLSAVALILLIACLNVANLLIVRSVSKRREVAVRLALGASRARIMTELVVQSGVLAIGASLIGVGLGRLTVSALVAIAPQTLPRLHEAGLDLRVLAFSMALAIVTTLLFGILPAWQASRGEPVETLRTTERVVAGTGVLRWRSLLMASEVALSAMLLVGAALMVKSLLTFNAVTLGFQPENVLAANVQLPESRYATADARLQFFERVADHIARLPGVTSVGFANRLPLRGGWSSGLGIEGADGEMLEADFQAVSPGYFPTLGIPLVSGRLLTDGDRTGRDGVAVVSEAFGRKWLNGRNPLGVRFRRGPQAPWITVVGVVGDVRRDGRATNIQPQVYLSAAQTSLYPVRLADLAVRASGNLRSLPKEIQTAVLAVDPQQPITNVRTLEEVLIARVADRRFQTLLFTLFAVLALVLAVIGIYGVISYSVVQRTPEIGLRMALGADRRRILRWVVRQAGILIGAGAAAGIAGARLLSGAIAALLFQVAPTDAYTYTAAAGILAVAAFAATYVAGRRAASIDPAIVLK